MVIPSPDQWIVQTDVEELEMLLKLDHPNIIKIFEASGRWNGTISFVTLSLRIS